MLLTYFVDAEVRTLEGKVTDFVKPFLVEFLGVEVLDEETVVGEFLDEFDETVLLEDLFYDHYYY